MEEGMRKNIFDMSFEDHQATLRLYNEEQAGGILETIGEIDGYGV